MASSMSFMEWTDFSAEEGTARVSRSSSSKPSPSKPRSRRISSTFFDDDMPMDERANDIETQRTQQPRRQEQQQGKRHQQQLTLEKQREHLEQQALQKLRQKQQQALEHQRRKQQAIEQQRRNQQEALELQRRKQQQMLQQQRQQQQQALALQRQQAIEQQRQQAMEHQRQQQQQALALQRQKQQQILQQQRVQQQALQQQQRDLQRQQQLLQEQEKQQRQRQLQQQQQQQALQRQHQLLQEQKRQEQERQQRLLQEQRKQQLLLQEQKRQKQLRNQQKKNNVTVVMEKQMDDIELVLSDAQSQLSRSRSLQSQSSSLSASLRSKKNTRYHSMAGDEDDSNQLDQVTRAVAGRLRELRRQSVLGRLATKPDANNGSSPVSAPTTTSVAPPSEPQINSQPSTRFAPKFHPPPPPPPATPPKSNKKFPRNSSRISWNDTDDSSDSSRDSSEEMQDNKRTAKRSGIVKKILIVIAVILVVAIGYLMGQWYQQSKLSKNTQQAEQARQQGNAPTMSPAAVVPNNAWPVEPPPEPVYGYDYTANSDFLVGVYYYPWHNQNFHNGGGYMRKELVPKHTPALGEYNDSDPGVISHHMKWFRQANIGLLVTSWWGPNRHEDKVTKDVIMEHEEVGNLKIALHYETTGRIGKQGEKLLTNAKPDIQYMCENYFDHPNYYKIDDRPVLFIYISRHLDTIGVLDEALLTMRSTASKCGHNLYLIGDSVFDAAPDPDQPHIPFWYFDAVTNYDVYGSSGRPEGHAGTTAVDDYYKNQAEWKEQALKEDCRYIPAVSPGYNDRGVRMEADHPPTSRRITSTSKEGSLFNYQLKQAKELVDSEVDKMILVNSFNEWHEDTQIEPVVGDPAIEPFNFTKGLEYVGYGELYLDILGAATSKDTRQHKVYDYLHDYPL